MVDKRAKLAHDATPGYFAAALCDVLRNMLVDARESFSFETVMSHESKIDLLKHAREHGFGVYVYYVATEDPTINVSRVAARVASKGHDVPKDKIIQRYERSLNLLPAAIQNCDHAWVFDNSTERADKVLIAEFDADGTIELKVEPEEMPIWFQKHVYDRIEAEA